MLEALRNVKNILVNVDGGLEKDREGWYPHGFSRSRHSDTYLGQSMKREEGKSLL
jgi:hypothetical protein